MELLLISSAGISTVCLFIELSIIGFTKLDRNKRFLSLYQVIWIDIVGEMRSQYLIYSHNRGE